MKFCFFCLSLVLIFSRADGDESHLDKDYVICNGAGAGEYFFSFDVSELKNKGSKHVNMNFDTYMKKVEGAARQCLREVLFGQYIFNSKSSKVLWKNAKGMVSLQRIIMEAGEGGKYFFIVDFNLPYNSVSNVIKIPVFADLSVPQCYSSKGD